MKNTSQPSVNFIKHLDVFLEIVRMVDSINFTHIALYLSLFRIWNINFFTNPISPSRDEIMKYAGLKSKESFYRLLREMQALDLIRYYPSKSKFEKSFYCLSRLEYQEQKIKITVYGLTDHIRFGQSQAQNNSISNLGGTGDIRSKSELINGKGILSVEKELYLNDDNLEASSIHLVPSSNYDPLNDPKYASHLDQDISSLSNNSNYANHQNSKSGRTNLRPPGVQIDPNADYSVPL